MRKCSKLLITIYSIASPRPQRARKSPYYSLYHERCRIYARQTSRYTTQTEHTTSHVYASLRLAEYLGVGVLHSSHFLKDRNTRLLASSLQSALLLINTPHPPCPLCVPSISTIGSLLPRSTHILSLSLHTPFILYSLPSHFLLIFFSLPS